ncbi:MAG: efflux RND transporter permease subunit [Verrucomicrobiota bacterium]
MTLTVAKRPGANAISVAGEVLRKVESSGGASSPTTSTYRLRAVRETAADKSNELLLHMGIAVIGVSLLIHARLARVDRRGRGYSSTLALTLLVFYLWIYTLNRITLFALIFSIGILVDDAIVVVENIVRHFHLPSGKADPGPISRSSGR